MGVSKEVNEMLGIGKELHADKVCKIFCFGLEQNSI